MPAPNPSSEPSPAASHRGRELLLWGTLVAVMLVLVAMSILGGGFQRPEPPPILGQLPTFELVDQQGAKFGSENLAGSPWVADFIFTRCPGICPRMTELMRGLKARLPPAVRTVSITVDPEHDTPPVLAEYAERFGAASDWVFLTGDRQQIFELSRDGFKLPVDPQAETADGTIEPILHSNRFVLVDAAGRIRGYYDSFDPAEIERLLDETRGMLRQRM